MATGEPPRPCGRGFWLRRSVGVTWHHIPHVTATNGSGLEKLVDEFVCFGLLGREDPAKARFWALLRALAAK